MRAGSARWASLLIAGAVAWLPGGAFAQEPYGLDARAPIGPYANGVLPPRAGAFAFPPTLSATGVFGDLQTLTPRDGYIPFAPNSPLWTDGAIKSRWMAVPNDGPPYDRMEQIGFAPVGEWTFPNGTVFVKQFDLVVNEATGERKRQETRLLVRDADGGVYGVTYKWRSDHSDADLLPAGLEEDVVITAASGAQRIQRYSYPSRADCLFCHNKQANYVLGAKTHQLNGDLSYPATGRTDNQLRALNNVGLLNPPPSDTTFASYMRSVAVTDPTATVQHRVRSWIDANCSHCHRPGGFGPGYDGRLYTPLEQQNLIDTYVRYRDLAGSELYQRDNSLGDFKMPPIAKNVIHEEAMAAMRQWIASPLRVLSVHLASDATHLVVRFNSRVDPQTIAPANFQLDRSATVTAAELTSEADTVLLTTTLLQRGEQYVLTVNRVQDTAPSANTIWPRSLKAFTAEFEQPATATRLANISTRVAVASGERVLIGGFIARGADAKRVMIRALGPSLTAAGISSILPNPALELFDGSGQSIAANSDWRDAANRQEMIDSGLAPVSHTEAALLVTLPASSSGLPYTVTVRGETAEAGVALIELYDLDRADESQLVNVSTRGFVETGEKVMISGTIISGTNAQKIVVRALGPSLTQAGIADALRDPQVELFNGNGDSVASNNDWRDAQQSELQQLQIAPTRETEAALIATLAPGHYTAVVRGNDGGTGIGLVEIYNLRCRVRRASPRPAQRRLVPGRELAGVAEGVGRARSARSGSKRPSVLPGAIGTQTCNRPLIIRGW